MFVVAGWLAGGSETLATMLGGSTVELSVAVVAVSFMVGMRIPPDLWPSAPLRPRFSLPVTLAVAVVIALLIVGAAGTELPRALLFEGRAAVPLVVGGAVGWALAWGRTPQEGYRRWFGIATAAAVVPVGVGALASTIEGQLVPLSLAALVPAGAFYLVIAATGALVTQELAFRRLLVGQGGDAGIGIVVGAAIAFAVWHLVIPTTGSPGQAAIGGLVNGVALGALYVLSRSLLVSAWYHGVQLGALNALRFQAADALGDAGLGGAFWRWQLVTTAVAAGILGFLVWRQNGVRGPLLRVVPSPPAAAELDAGEDTDDADGD